MIVDCGYYLEGRREGGRLELDDVADALRHERGFVWIGLHEPAPAELAKVAELFDLHELAVEDALMAHQRPKLEMYGETAFLVLKTASYDETTETVQFGEIQIFLGVDFVVVVRHGVPAGLAMTRQSLEQQPALLDFGASAVLYAVIDHVVDEYQPVLHGLEDDIGEVEFQVFGDPRLANAERIYKLKREVLEMQRAARPLVSAVERLVLHPMPEIDERIRPYFRDVQDNLLRVIEQLETQRDLLTSALEANLSQLGIRQNEDMRKISAWVAIMAVPTMLAGIWGMNFDHMPELDESWAYPFAISVMVTAALLLWRGFRKAGWL